MKEKNELLRSENLNELYLEMNLVIGYLNSPEQIPLETQINQLTQGNDEKQSIDYINYEKGLKQQINIEEAILKQIIFEGDIAFFFNYVIYKIIKMSQQGIIKFTQELYYYQIFCISKNQNVHLKRIYDKLMSTYPDKFNRAIWSRYQISFEQMQILTITKNDIKHAEDFIWKFIRKKSKSQIIINLITKVEINKISFGFKFRSQYFLITLSISYLFKSIFRFKDINMYFNLFYEEILILIDTQLLELIGKGLNL
ncbi:unnamed protein product [Paramecium primaurelia]|uniref:Uncharacterized protein n=1 Tax=Paramecium primaurelia TaxID=5886 RepID=A0A8S1LN68_PARPR|nr:unnamed protein product [Paramecium primaurelia]